MKLDMFQKVRLKDGRPAHVVEIYNDGEAYEMDILTNEDKFDNVSTFGKYETDTIYPKDIRSIVVEVEKPFLIAI